MDLNTVKEYVNFYRSSGMSDHEIMKELVNANVPTNDILAAFQNAPAMGQAAAPLANYEIKQERPEPAESLEYVIDDEILNQPVGLHGLLNSYQLINPDDNAVEFVNEDELDICKNNLNLAGDALFKMATCIKNKKIEAYAAQHLGEEALNSLKQGGCSLDEIFVMAMDAKRENLLKAQKAQEEERLLQEVLNDSSHEVGHNKEIKQEIVADDDALDYLSNEQLRSYTDMRLSPDEILAIATQVKQEKLLKAQEEEKFNKALALSKAEAAEVNEKRRVTDEKIKLLTGNNYNNGRGAQGYTGMLMANDQDHEKFALLISKQNYEEEQQRLWKEAQKQNRKND
jgi:predicted Fe-Mo cluster-binding NifX family protein